MTHSNFDIKRDNMPTLLKKFTDQLNTQSIKFIEDNHGICLSSYDELSDLRRILIEVTAQVTLSDIKASLELQAWFEKGQLDILNKLAGETELDWSYIWKELLTIKILLLELTLGNDYQAHDGATEQLQTWLMQQDDIEYGLLENARENQFESMHDEIIFIKKMLLD